MSTAVEQTREIETLAWITDDEAEFWTSSSARNRSVNEDLTLKNSWNRKNEDHLTLFYKEKLVKEANEIKENAGKFQIFEFERNIGLNENAPSVPKSFFERLIHQITRPQVSNLDGESDEDFTEIDQNEITSVVNQNAEELHNLKNESSLKTFFQSFIEELSEETDVILGKIDNETLFNRRTHRVRTSSDHDEKRILFFF